ncbi:XRE family transcriptional regulator [Neobacillus pocheonensis]|uniref:XRE family transcriptional regulator n=1 Tax=Neobacillus pocheonensis TaxID=363869 RepID=A0ABT0W7X0_9BACI|nr:XRE family transcriptional regulator [Neobacillus pocheonensis]
MDKDFLSAQIGQRLRYYRQQRKLTLDELADLTGVSKPMLGQIERGSSNPTVSILWKIAAGLQVPFASFLTKNPSVKIIRKDEQPFFKEDHDLFEVYNNFASPGVPFESYRIRLLPGCKHLSEPNGIGTLKSITVHSGIFSIRIGEADHYSLKKGDSVSFSTDVSQIYENVTETVCEINMVIYYSSPNIQL